jgi:hypothetical protein
LAEEESARAPETADVQIESRAVDADQQATDLDQQAHEQKRRARRSQKRQEIRSDLQFMVAANREAGGQGVYAGFRYVRAGGIEAALDEEPYLGALLPLKVATKFPRLMAFTTVAYEDVFANEQLDPATRTVVRPGRFRRYGLISLVSRLNSLLLSSAYVAGVLVAVAAFVRLALWLRRGG